MNIIKYHWKDFIVGVFIAIIILIVVKYKSKKEIIVKNNVMISVVEIDDVKSYERLWEYIYDDNGKIKSEFRCGDRKNIGDTLIIKTICQN